MFPREPNAAEQIGDEILLWSDYVPEFVDALKEAVPWRDRRWDGKRQCWIVNARHFTELRQLVREHLGYMLVVT